MGRLVTQRACKIGNFGEEAGNQQLKREIFPQPFSIYTWEEGSRKKLFHPQVENLEKEEQWNRVYPKTQKRDTQ